MSLITFIADECAMYTAGRCDLTGCGSCRVPGGERCAYFEESVAPIVHAPDPDGEKGLRARQARDLETYKETRNDDA